LCCTTVLFSCKKTEIVKPEPLPTLNIPSDTNGFFEIHINNVVNSNPLALGTSTYTNLNSDTFSVDILQYYFTNVELHTLSGDTFKEVESYYLVDQANPNSLHLMVKGVPRADYSSIRFLIGVDAKRNTSGAQTGALDPIHGMFWTWSTGYIMAKMEGYSPQSGATNKKLAFHIGGFSGVNSAIKTVNLTFPNSANVTPSHTPILTLKADLASWFASPNLVSFNTMFSISSVSANSKAIADNYANMFSVISVTN
jgi:hypothetical protein